MEEVVKERGYLLLLRKGTIFLFWDLVVRVGQVLYVYQAFQVYINNIQRWVAHVYAWKI